MKRKLYILMVMILMVGLFLFGVRQLQAKASQQEIDALNAQIEERKTKIDEILNNFRPPDIARTLRRDASDIAFKSVHENRSAFFDINYLLPTIT